MIKLIRWLLGLCNHTYDTTSTVPVTYQGNEGNMLDIDMAFKGVVKYYAIARCVPNQAAATFV